MMRRAIAGMATGVLVACLMAIPIGADEGITPTILLYSGTDPGFANMLATLIEEDERIDSKTRVVTSPDIIGLATALPQTECVVIYSANKAEIGGLETNLLSFFEQGGGVVGMREVCFESSAGELATKVFPIFGNASVKQLNPSEFRARNYVADDTVGEINSGLPGSFPLLSMGTYFSGDSENMYVEVPGDYQVPYRDDETGSPLVATLQSEKGGRSVALPGIWVIPVSRVDVYYGNLVADENFVKLFTNSVLWAAKGSSRFGEVSQGLEEKIEEAKGKQEKLKEEAEKARRRERTQRTLILIAIWAVGLLASGLVIKKLILVPIEVES